MYFWKDCLDLEHCIIESVLTWTILIHIHSEKGNVTRSKMPDMKEMSPAMRPSHSCALSSVSQRLFGLSSMIGDNWLSKCPSFMALTAIKKKRKWFQTKLAKCSMIDGWNYRVWNKWFYVDFPGTVVPWSLRLFS